MTTIQLLPLYTANDDTNIPTQKYHFLSECFPLILVTRIFTIFIYFILAIEVKYSNPLNPKEDL